MTGFSFDEMTLESRALVRDLGAIDAAVILGSGLAGGADVLEAEAQVGYDQLPVLGGCAVPGHEGVLKVGRAAGLRVAVFCGRRHYYETGSMESPTFIARLARDMGARLLVPVSAVGGVDPHLGVGSWVYVTDHINLMGANPLVGTLVGGRPPFVDLTHTYRTDLFDEIAGRIPPGITVRSSVLAAFSGPTYETPAEIRMCAALGAGIVGMSTVPEAVMGKMLEMDVAAWGRVVNPAAGVGGQPLRHEDVVREAQSADADTASIIEATLSAWADTKG